MQGTRYLCAMTPSFPSHRPAAERRAFARRVSLAFGWLVLCLTGQIAQASAAECPVSPGEVRVPGGKFTMGMDSTLPEESPKREVAVSEFWMDRTEVTNAQFTAFVKATGYRTQAERGWAGNPRVPRELQAPGSVVFKAPKDLAAPEYSWWVFTPGANWRHPEGPRSSLKRRLQHPVVHVTADDALA
jgi:formylglycine-generating enzyme required for sulfatase activity